MGNKQNKSVCFAKDPKDNHDSQPAAPIQETVFFGLDSENKPKLLGFCSKTENLRQLKIPNNFKIYNYAQAIIIDEGVAIITGGVNKEKSHISTQALIYDSTLETAVELPEMMQGRFSHISLYYRKKIYVFGGRSKPGDENILSSAECLGVVINKKEEEKNSNTKSGHMFDVESDKEWMKLPDSILKRCTGFSLVYRDEIYLIGGYTGQRKRSKKIEKFSLATNKWTLIELKLIYGVERGVLLGGKPNQFIIFGGKIRSGDTKMIYVYDLFKESYTFEKEMISERVLQKGFVGKNGFIYMLGGDAECSSERGKKSKNGDFKWEKVPIDLKSHFTEQIKLFTYSQHSVIVAEDRFIPEDKVPSINHFILFGNDLEPQIFLIDVEKGEIGKRSVPSPLRLYGYQGGVRLDTYRYFLCGGLFFSRKKISKSAFIYDSRNNSAEKLKKMKSYRYTTNIILKNNYIFVLGGRAYGEDQSGILKTCEKFNLNTMKWESMADMNTPRCTGMVFLLEGLIYIAGGYRGEMKRETSFEVYNDYENIWNLISVDLPEPLEAAIPLVREDVKKLFLIGGRNKQGDTDSISTYDFSFGIDTLHYEIPNPLTKLACKRCLHKMFVINTHILIFGGENFDNLFFEFMEINKNSGFLSNSNPNDIPQNELGLAKALGVELKARLKDPKLNKYCFL